MLHVIGDGPIRQDLEHLARELNVYEDTIFYGYMLHPEQFMPFFDIFVLPSRAEAFGSVFAEAALCMLALVGTRVGGIAEQIEDGVNGLLVEPDNPEALADALEKLIADPALRIRLARAARNKAKQEYSLSRVIRQLKEVYAEFGVGKEEAPEEESALQTDGDDDRAATGSRANGRDDGTSGLSADGKDDPAFMTAAIRDKSGPNGKPAEV